MNAVLLIRHGATKGNLERRYIGRTDEPLCPVGVEQIKALRKPAAEHIFVSPMLRTRQTAQQLFPDQTHILLEGLRETDFGIFEGKSADELAENPDYRAWVDGWCRGPIPGGESKEDVVCRAAAAFLQAMERTAEGETAAFVTHGGVIMALMERFGGAEFYSGHIKNGGYLRCIWDGESLRVLEKG